jgi:UDPglucose 6-dehydrogenase
MRLGIIGMGTVGTALFNTFSEKFDVVGWDKKKDFDPYEGLLEADVIFLCVPTPTQMHQRGEVGFGVGQSLQHVHTTMSELSNKGYRGIIVIKSTVLPGTGINLSKYHPNIEVINNPEFLSQETAEEDFRNCKTVLLGGDNKRSLDVVADIYKKIGVKEAVYVTNTEAETVKYMANVFFAVKIALFNEFYDVCRERKVNYQLCADLAADMTGWINKKHINVPGPDGNFGFGGACFPKDIEAFMVKYRNLDITTVKGAIESNRKRRRSASKINLTDRADYIRKKLTAKETNNRNSGRNNRSKPEVKEVEKASDVQESAVLTTGVHA